MAAGNVGGIGNDAANRDPNYFNRLGRGMRLGDAQGPNGQPVAGGPVNNWNCCCTPRLPNLNADQKETLKKVGIALMVIALVATLFTTSFASKGAMTGSIYSKVSLGFSAMGLIGAVTYTSLSAENKKRFGIFLTVVFIALTTLFALSSANVISHQVPMITIWTVEGLLAITMTVFMCYRMAKLADGLMN